MCFTSQSGHQASRMREWGNFRNGQPNHNNNQAVLQANGFTETKWALASKSDDSYTKREAATVQGAQQ